MENTRRQLISFDILRIFACFSVVAVHLSIVFNIPGRIGQIMEAGSNGLGIFYILSGFLIFQSLDNRKITIGKWYVKRLTRIVPMYYAVLVVYIILYEGILKTMPEDPFSLKWISYFLGINSILKRTSEFWYNLGALSSMSVFIWFYILAPLIHKLVCSWKRALVFFVFCYGLLRVLQHTDWLKMFTAYYYFALGILVYYAVNEGRCKITTIMLLCVCAFLILADARGGILYALIIGMIMLMTCDISIENASLVRVIRFISDRTFAIYLAHVTVVYIMWVALQCSKGIGMILLGLALTIIGIFVLHEIVEKGLSKLLKRLNII